MHLHFLGICGTFMGSLAQLAKALGHEVTGSDAQVYPPMSDQLEAAGIVLHEGYDYDPSQFRGPSGALPDQVVVGNAMSRGKPCVEALLESQVAYISGPQWLHDHVLPGRWVLAVAGTHGKTSTASLLAWILEWAGMSPGFLIGGVPGNFEVSARLGDTPFFVVEADEYDTAFFDKRSKFVHYAPRTLILNNLEYDHADIFPDLAAIERQFQHLLRLVPGSGRVIMPEGDEALARVRAQGCWSEVETFAIAPLDEVAFGQWQARAQDEAGQHFDVWLADRHLGTVQWTQTGTHNMRNALAALAAARHVGVAPDAAVAALNQFRGVKRRMELRGEVDGIEVFDDFAHHPTAIATTLAGACPGAKGRLIAVIEPRSNTMKLGTHQAQLPASVAAADQVYWFQGPGVDWDVQQLGVGHVMTDLSDLVKQLVETLVPGDRVVIMSNGGFGGVHQQLLDALRAREIQV
ncbi:UDP-N-acetylmuramate:L-alanyl-gamma-D-glutamyl-meso-diaminopimelate ligase [Terasakiispira papahanaumokuakeensis]|uniref:UDP-N-acetylmuramate--L-alanyl-gamma-D-glutamyl-meso-2,6-diaminoheptandioate ligase n=1 Tax=Terasakiispira papahanaumokuakeensis TaxID=197479 RepID=A0A1E2VAL2_9GAMM|nr:UDP-N-acetylmuramate:L-alanyl-gamma-D-glutamyl-meso-diaminopimelate ligase [Terasakiispira papahanaumokuakeensis]ODC03963.1 UDP-N-acetylmuramate:L-alanyl-gamma-D-glutamyl-meso-diaminopimelate ligase [Terasakiispira papahanaumokuakeensis]